MKYTDNLNLRKPEQTEFYDVDDFNYNADILDEEIQGIKNTFVKSVNGINAGDDGNVDLGIIPIAKGGTGATTANDACNNLGLSMDYWSRYGANFTPSDTSNRGWNSLGIFKSYYTQANSIKNQPTIYGQLLNIPVALNNEESMQIWIQQASGDIYVRGGNQYIPINDTAFRKLSVDIAGTIFAFAGNDIPSGYLPCNGSAISRETYADLFAVIGTTYGSGDGSTTFNLPNLNNNSFLEGSDTVGTVKSAGLPNITARTLTRAANIDNTFFSEYNTSGAFDAAEKTKDWKVGLVTSSAEVGQILKFNASKSNSIYGNSTTVQPKSVTVMYIIKY